MQEVRRCHRMDVARGDARERRSLAHLLEHVVRRGIRADRHVDAGFQVAAEALEHVPVARERRGTVRDAAAVLRHQREVLLGPPSHPGMRVDEDGVAQQRARVEDAELRRPLDRRHAVAADHLQHLAHALGDMHGERQLAFGGRGVGVAQQLGRAGVDLHRREHPGEPAARVLRQPVDEAERRFEALAPGLLVPFVAQLVVVRELPARGRKARREESAQTAAPGQVRPAVPGRADVHDRSDAASQELAVGEFGGRGPAFAVGGRVSLRALEKPGHVHVAHAVFLADAAIGRLVSRMRMHVDQARHHHAPRALDRRLGPTLVARAHISNRAAVERNVDIAPVDRALRRFVPGDRPVRIADHRRGHVLEAKPALRNAQAAFAKLRELDARP